VPHTRLCSFLPQNFAIPPHELSTAFPTVASVSRTKDFNENPGKIGLFEAGSAIAREFV
jgi:hypothetical protein